MKASSLSKRACPIGLPFFVLTILCPWALARDKIDVIVLKNGDRITCEIKGLEKGQLSIKTDYTIGTILVNWKEVTRVKSRQRFQLEDESGDRYTGTLEVQPDQPLDAPVQLDVRDQMGSVQLEKDRVVLVRPMDQGFWGKVDGSIDYGFDFTRANSETSSTLHSSLSYVEERYSVSLDASSLFSGQTDGVSTNRHNLSINTKRFLRRKKWFGVGIADFLQNDQQELDLRTTVGGGVGVQLLQTNRSRFLTSGGVVLNNERFSPVSGRTVANNTEGLIALEYSTFRFDSTAFDTTFVVFPSLSEGGRFRMTLNTSLKLDLVGDLYWKFSFFDNFDSRPPAATPNNDFGVSSTVGWSF